jgi:hypothetical protein
MPDAKGTLCARCGASLSPDDPKGVCPRCQVDEVIDEPRAAVRLNPDDAEAHSDLGRALIAQGNGRTQSPSCAGRSAFSLTTPRPTTTLASRSIARISWSR